MLWAVGSLLAGAACINPQMSVQPSTSTDALRNGDPLTTVSGLSDGQRASVGIFMLADRARWCTAALLDARHAVTAAHCFSSSSFELAQLTFEMSFVPGGAGDSTFLPVVDVHIHPELDVAVASLGAVALGTPIRVSTAPLDDAALGTEVVVIGGGIGTPPADGLSAGHFAIDSFDDTVLHLRAIDDDGLCSGDSGSPVLAFDEEGPRILGVHTRGFSDCAGLSTEVRADVVASFLEAAAADAPPVAESCVDGADADRCEGAVVRRCVEGSWRTLDCGLAAFQCVLLDGVASCEPVPCGDVAAVGRCDEGVARVCRGGTLVEEDCRSTGQGCAFDSVEARFGCVDCTACDGVCVDLSNDREHCGACGRVCAGACLEGACELPDPEEPGPASPDTAPDPDELPSPSSAPSCATSCAQVGSPDMGDTWLFAACAWWMNHRRQHLRRTRGRSTSRERACLGRDERANEHHREGGT